MIDTQADSCGNFQRVAWEWLQSGEITRTAHLLSPLEELAGFHYGFVYLLQVPGDAAAIPDAVFKIGFSEHPTRRLRELQPHYGGRLRLRACFVGDPGAERFAHRRFAALRIKNELFYAHPVIEEYFRTSRERMRETIRALHLCSQNCPQMNPRLDLRVLGAWLAR